MLEKKPAFQIKTGDLFRYQGWTYRAVSEPTGEFATYINVTDTEGREMEIYLPSGAEVFVGETLT
jgi:hypothetical protein